MKAKLILVAALAMTASVALAAHGYKIVKNSSRDFAVVNDADGRVLAYGDTPCDTTNPGFKWWLRSVAQLPQTKVAKKTKISPASLGFPSTCEPLLTTTWGQEAPYNFMCPTTDYAPWGGFLPEAEHCPVGCVATATAQIMNYFKYPTRGQGTCSITLDEQSYVVDLSQATYDWSLMLDDFSTATYTTAQAMAVAQLCYHVGVASRMGYRAEASATDNYYALVALRDNFDYDVNPANNLQRDNFSDEEWMRRVYTELSEGRPILYEGLGIDFETYGVYGHSFVIDGYDAAGLVHVNWGWNGKCNGYYDIALLNPSDLHFDDFQMMATGIKPKYHEVEVTGDVNGDGQVTAADVTALYNLLLNGDNSMVINGDVNADGNITSGDVTAVYNILLGGS